MALLIETQGHRSPRDPGLLPGSDGGNRVTLAVYDNDHGVAREYVGGLSNIKAKCMKRVAAANIG
ncbi:MAG TPA: hypothetical protein DCW29_09210 [Janthinobacterium sp.]|nr:hypothetical protein [Janthinobacterium sp.]